MCWNFRIFFMTLKKANVDWNEKGPEFLRNVLFEKKKTEARNYTDGNRQTKWICFFFYFSQCESNWQRE